jgi:hypothetical protein
MEIIIKPKNFFIEAKYFESPIQCYRVAVVEDEITNKTYSIYIDNYSFSKDYYEIVFCKTPVSDYVIKKQLDDKEVKELKKEKPELFI